MVFTAFNVTANVTVLSHLHVNALSLVRISNSTIFNCALLSLNYLLLEMMHSPFMCCLLCA